jgi:hypothetical protein
MLIFLTGANCEISPLPSMQKNQIFPRWVSFYASETYTCPRSHGTAGQFDCQINAELNVRGADGNGAAPQHEPPPGPSDEMPPQIASQSCREADAPLAAVAPFPSTQMPGVDCAHCRALSGVNALFGCAVRGT